GAGADAGREGAAVRNGYRRAAAGARGPGGQHRQRRRLARPLCEGRRAQGSLEPSLRLPSAGRRPGLRPRQPGQGRAARRRKRGCGREVRIATAVAATMRRTVPGFTLLEVVLVLAIVALASLLAAAAIGGGADGMRLRSAAKEVAAQLRFTRAQALATGEPQRF